MKNLLFILLLILVVPRAEAQDEFLYEWPRNENPLDTDYLLGFFGVDSVQFGVRWDTLQMSIGITESQITNLDHLTAAEARSALVEGGSAEMFLETLGTACADRQVGKANATGGVDCGPDDDTPEAGDFTGTPDGTKFLRDDMSWAVPPGDGGGSSSLTVEADDGTPSISAVTRIQFAENAFTVTNEGAGLAQIDPGGGLLLEAELDTEAELEAQIGVGVVTPAEDDDTPDSDAEVPDAITVDGGTVQNSTVVLNPSPGAAPVTAGDAQFDTTDECMVVGKGGTTLEICDKTQINTQSGTAYTLALSDNNSLVRTTSASAVTVTVPTNAAVAFPVGALVWIKKSGTGNVTISGDTGVTVDGTASITTQYDDISIIKVATDTWETSDDANSGGSGVTDGDKGDITVSGGGVVWNIDPGVVGVTEFETSTLAGNSMLANAINYSSENGGGWLLEGTTADGFEARLSAGDPTQDRDLELPDASGVLQTPNSTAAYFNKNLSDASNTLPETVCIPASDETTNLTTGTAKVTFNVPFAFNVSSVWAYTNSAPATTNLVVDINEDPDREGASALASILSTTVTIEAGERSSVTATTAPVISDASIAAHAELTVDIDQADATTPGTGLKVCLDGTR